MFSLKYFTFFIILLAFLVLGTPAKIVVLSICIIYSLLGITQSLETLTISFIIFLINPALYGEGSELVVVLRMLLFIVASFSVISRTFLKRKKPVSVNRLIILILLIFTTSIISSYHLQVSLFKLFLFSIGSLSVLLGFTYSSRSNEKWIQWFISLWSAILVLSIPFIMIPEIGYAQNGMGFQGITNHPQAFGIVLTPILAFILGKVFFEKSKISQGLVVVSLLCIIEIVLSQARTGLVAMFVGFIFMFVVTFVRSAKWRKYWLLPFKSLKYRFGIIILIILLPVILSNFQEVIFDYALKGRGEGNIGDSFYESRGFLILMQFENIKENPIYGIGFQLATLPKQLKVVTDPFLGLPIKASIEKGNIFTAVVEENGIVGGLGFLFFIFGHFGSFIKKNAFGLLWCAMTGFFINIGEGVFFSLSGIGLYVWLMMGLGLNYKIKK